MKEGQEESRFITDTGTVVCRLEGSAFSLGLSTGRKTRQKPDVAIQLTREQAKSLIEELRYWLLWV